MMETAISTLTNFHTSKEGIDRFVAQVVSEVRDGVYNPLQLKIFLKAIQKSCEELEKQTNDLSLTEAEKHGLRSFEIMGNKVELSELGVSYDYNACNDIVWIHLDEKIKKLAEEKKEREKFLKTITQTMGIANEETEGETVYINPPIKKSTSGLKITIK